MSISSSNSIERAASANLCEFCSSLNLASLGFYVESEDHHQRDGRPALVGGDAITIRKMTEVLLTSRRCSLCRQFAEILQEYIRPTPLDDDELDFGILKAVMLYRGIEALSRTTGEGEIRGQYVRLLLSVDVEDSLEHRDEDGCGERTFLRCSDKPADVNDFCSLESIINWDVTGAHPFEGRTRPLVANTKLFMKWLETCRFRHGSSCRARAVDSGSAKLRFVDVETRKVVDGNMGNHYFALSYLWGSGGAPLRLTRAATSLFYQLGHLKSNTLPATIEDAIQLTAALGGRYLWVDCLCIVQDDEADKAEFLPKMHLIYNNSEITIVAAAGVNCQAGLPGIRLGTRSATQEIITFGELPVFRSLDPGSDPAEKGGLYLGNTAYMKRGWCFQERLLSYRCLIFAPEQVYWECQETTWCEESYWESSKAPALYRHSLGTSINGCLPLGCQPGTDFVGLFKFLVQSYSRLNLSFDGDQLSAFEGILEALEAGFNEPFFWALPLSFFEHSLSWTDGEGMRRNNATHIMKRRDGATVAVPLPSWSWVGWIGENGLAEAGGQWRTEPNLLRLYHINDEGAIQELGPQKSTRTAVGTTLPSWADPTITVITTNHVPEHVLGTPLVASVLCFWGSVCRAEIRFKRFGFADIHQKDLSFSVTHHKMAHPFVVDIDYLVEEPADFVVIHRSVGNNNKGHLDLLRLKWNANVAYRYGLYHLAEEDWEKLETSWEVVILS